VIERISLKQSIQNALERQRVVALIGPRQCGKTTLARQLVEPTSPNYFDLEDPLSLARLEQPMLALQSLSGLVVIDEIQRRPELFPILRVLVDRDPLPARFLILGSASLELIQRSSESLAGRLTTLHMSGFSLAEVGVEAQNQHWLRGGFPRSYTASTVADSFEWRKDFVRTFLERDIPQLGLKLPTASLARFWNLLAHYHGQVWNASEAARTLQVSQSTVRRYLDLLEDLFMIRQLQPWFANLSKRQVKAPKIYFRDSGLLHYWLSVRTESDLALHARMGASWEGYAQEEVIKALQPDEVYFWGTHSGAELDLLLVKNGRRLGIECKYMDAPRLTASMRTALTDLTLEQLLIVYPGPHPFALTEKVFAVPLSWLVTAENSSFPYTFTAAT
jgi:hypothetical protein